MLDDLIESETWPQLKYFEIAWLFPDRRKISLQNKILNFNWPSTATHILLTITNHPLNTLTPRSNL